MDLRDLLPALRKLRARVDGLVVRGTITRVDGARKTIRLQLTLGADEVPPGDVELVQPYGLSFTPPAGAEAIGVAVQGARSHIVGICAHHPGERPTDAPAQAGGLYTKSEWRLYIGADGVVVVGSKESSEHIALGDSLIAAIKALTVPTAMGPSGTPINAVQFDTCLSKHKVSP
jgi:phage gp45-like